MKNKKGFTLIEILSVIVILGIIMIIAVPAVSEYIVSSRKSAYASSISAYLETVRGEYEMKYYGSFLYDDEIMIVPIDLVDLEQGVSEKTPFGDFIFEKSYVVVVPERNSYQFYANFMDSAGYGVKMVPSNAISREYIEKQATIDEILDWSAYETGFEAFVHEGKSYSFCDDRTSKNARSGSSSKILVLCEDGGSSGGGTPSPTPTPTTTDEACFEFDSTSGTITKYLCADFETQYPNNTIYDVVIPKTIGGVTVKKIAKETFEKTAIYTVEIPENVEEIEPYAFDYAPLLYNVVNKTGRTFNWGTATMVSGDYDSYSFSSFKITTERVSYDLSNIFTIDDILVDFDVEDEFLWSSGMAINIVDTKGYDVYVDGGSLNNQKVENGNVIVYSGLKNVNNNVDNDFTVDKLVPNKNYIVLPVGNIARENAYTIYIKSGGEQLYFGTYSISN